MDDQRAGAHEVYSEKVIPHYPTVCMKKIKGMASFKFDKNHGSLLSHSVLPSSPPFYSYFFVNGGSKTAGIIFLSGQKGTH